MINRNKKERPASPKRSRGGQAMILTVMLLSGAILSASALAALLVLFQLRQASDIKSSTQAIFAADSGIECILYEAVVNGASGVGDFANCGELALTPPINLDNGASYVVTVGVGAVKSAGRAGKTSRAFEVSF